LGFISAKGKLISAIYVLGGQKTNQSVFLNSIAAICLGGQIFPTK